MTVIRPDLWCLTGRLVALAMFGAALVSHDAQAQSAGNNLPAASADTIVVIASRRAAALGDPQPIAVLLPRTLLALDGETIGALLKQLTAQTRTSGADQTQLLLLNGRRVVNDAEVYDIPSEAIERVEVLPQAEADRYGLKRSNPVLNFVIKANFHRRIVDVKSGKSTGIGGDSYDAQANYFAISNNGRVNVALKFSNASPVYEAPALSPQSGAGAGSAVAGPIVRTVVAANRAIDLTVTASQNLGQKLVATADATLNATRNDGLAGPATADPSAADGPVSGGSALTQHDSSLAGHAGITLATGEGQWTTALLAAYDYTRTRSDTQTGVLVLNGKISRSSLRNVSQTRLASLGLHGNGTILRAPAGPITAELSLDANTGTTSFGQRLSLAGPTAFARREASARVDINLPLLDHGVGSGRFGDFSIALGAVLHAVSGFGLLGDTSAGLNWTPTRPLTLSASFTTAHQAPLLQQLDGTTTITPNVQIFDFTTGQTVLATATVAGNPRLRAAMTRNFAVDAALQLFAGSPVSLTFGYTSIHLTDQSLDIPLATTALETAFPGFFLRNGSGQLVQVDARPVNIPDETKVDVRMGLAWAYGFAGGDADDAATRQSQPVTFGITLNHTWHLQDKLRISAMSAGQDLLAGMGSLGNTGFARHEFDIDINAARAGVGVHATARWLGPSRVNGNGSDNIYFSPSLETEFSLFSDLHAILENARWARATRITLALSNPIGARQHAGVRSKSSLPGLDALAQSVQLRAIALKLRSSF